MTPLPIILVGCGAVSQQFYRPTLLELEAHGILKLATAVDPNASARQAILSRFPHAQPANDLTEVKLPPGALAIIASPPKFHCAQTLAAFERGWHVLCEKPMAGTVADCDRMIAGAAAAGRTLAVGHYKRFFPASAQLRAFCTEPAGPLGRLRSVRIAEGGPFNWPAASPSFFKKEETPGGVLLDIGVHVLDLLMWWLGEPVSFTYADDAMGGLETNVRLKLQFRDAIEVDLQLSRDWPTPSRYDFAFERGAAAWTVNDANGLTVSLAGVPHGLRSTLLGPDRAPAATNAQTFIRQLQHVVESIQSGNPVLVDGTEGARALRLIEACYQRRTLLPQPWLTPAEAARAAAVC